MEPDALDASSLEPLETFPNDLLPDLPHIPEMLEVSADTEADIYRHGVARIELLGCLATDPDVCARVGDWASAIGLTQASEDMARVLEMIARCCGLRHRSDLWGPLDLEPREPVDEVQDQALTRQLAEARERYHAALAREPEVREAAWRYVRDELGLHWGPWLAWTLFVQVFYNAQMYALGVERAFAFGYERPDPPAQEFTFTFARRPGETASALRQRFIEEANAALATIQPVPDAPEQTPLGRQRQDLEEKTRRHVRWVYRRVFRNEGPLRLARDYHDERAKGIIEKPCKNTFPTCGCPKIVRRGLKEGVRVLSLTPYSF